MCVHVLDVDLCMCMWACMHVLWTVYICPMPSLFGMGHDFF
jgi:hypothetical protein